MAGAVEGEVVRGAHTRTSRSHTVRRAEASSICRRVSMTLCVSFRSKRAKVASSSWATEQAGGAGVSGCCGGDRGTRRGRQGASDATRGVSCDRGGSDNKGSRVARARGPCPTPVRAGARAKEARLGGVSCLERLEERLEQRRLAQARLADHHQVERLTGWVAREARLHAPVVVRVPCRRTHRAHALSVT